MLAFAARRGDLRLPRAGLHSVAAFRAKLRIQVIGAPRIPPFQLSQDKWRRFECHRIPCPFKYSLHYAGRIELPFRSESLGSVQLGRV